MSEMENLADRLDGDVPEHLVTCPCCDGSGIEVYGITIREPGCHFSHDSSDERECPECKGLGVYVGDAEPDDKESDIVNDHFIPIYPCRGWRIEINAQCEALATGMLYSVQGHFIGYHCADCAARLIEHAAKWESRRLPGHEENPMRANRFERDPAITPERIADLVASLRAEKDRPDCWLAAGLIEQVYLIRQHATALEIGRGIGREEAAKVCDDAAERCRANERKWSSDKSVEMWRAKAIILEQRSLAIRALSPALDVGELVENGARAINKRAFGPDGYPHDLVNLKDCDGTDLTPDEVNAIGLARNQARAVLASLIGTK